ncbi:hypothetical protein WDW86_05280 [Bdellovibrionota bacterium FG-2]
MEKISKRTTAKPRAVQLALPLRGLKTGKAAKEHGGEAYAKSGRRKTARPFDPGKPLHITMRSSIAVEERSMLHPKRARIIKNIVYNAAKRQGIVIKRYVCVGNHLHLLLQTKARRMIQARPALRAFLREVGGLVARVVTGAEKGRPLNSPIHKSQKNEEDKRRFWDYLAWSRIVTWGKNLIGVGKYFLKNEYDAVHILALNNWPDVTLDTGHDTRVSPG